jgi:flavin reductase (DIM6/NTAB) family NADH-FMN oxidoreductase RutF
VSVDPVAFRALLSRFPSGVTIVSARDETGRDCGMTVSAFCSVSLVPPLVLVCVDHDATMHAVLMREPDIGISVLSAAQRGLSEHFAERDAHGWEEVPHTRGESGVPLVAGAAATLECRVQQRHEAGDHTVLIAEVLRGSPTDAAPLVYYRGTYAGISP